MSIDMSKIKEGDTVVLRGLEEEEVMGVSYSQGARFPYDISFKGFEESYIETGNVWAENTACNDIIEHFPKEKEAIYELVDGKLPRKTAKEMGFKVGDKFIVVEEESSTTVKGDILTLERDDGSLCPKFSGSSKTRGAVLNGNTFVYLYYLAPYIEEDVKEEVASNENVAVGDIIKSEVMALNGSNTFTVVAVDEELTVYATRINHEDTELTVAVYIRINIK